MFFSNSAIYVGVENILIRALSQILNIQKYKDNVLNDYPIIKYSEARVLILNNYYECIIKDNTKQLKWRIPPYPEVWQKIMDKRYNNPSALVISSDCLYNLSLDRIFAVKNSQKFFVVNFDNIAKAVIPLLHDYRNVILEEPYYIAILKKIIKLLDIDVHELEESFYYSISSSIDSHWIKRFIETYKTEN